MYSCQKEYFYRGYVQEYTESRYIKLVACINMHNSSLIMHVHVTMFVSVHVYYQTGLLYATYMYNHLVSASVLCT